MSPLPLALASLVLGSQRSEPVFVKSVLANSLECAAEMRPVRDAGPIGDN
jgi:hypothetical protein